MFEATWAEETFQIPHCEMDWSSSAQSSEWDPDWRPCASTETEGA